MWNRSGVGTAQRPCVHALAQTRPEGEQTPGFVMSMHVALEWQLTLVGGQKRHASRPHTWQLHEVFVHQEAA